jgi:hypothetical protein
MVLGRSNSVDQELALLIADSPEVERFLERPGDLVLGASHQVIKSRSVLPWVDHCGENQPSAAVWTPVIPKSVITRLIDADVKRRRHG